MKKMGKGLMLMLAVLLIATGFPVKQSQASAESDETIAEPSRYYVFTDMRTWAVVGNGYTTRGGFVGALQSNLWAQGYRSTVGSVDEIFGSATRSGVLSYQRKYGLTADGIVGRGTWGKMDAQTRNHSKLFRTYNGTSTSGYYVEYQGASGGPGSGNNYYLRRSSDNEWMAIGTMWTSPGYPIPQNLLVEEPISPTPPTNEELAELDIPVQLQSSENVGIATQADTEIRIYDLEEGKTAVAWFHTKTEPITVSEWTYGPESTVDDIVKEAASWHEHYQVDITDFNGNPMVVSDKGDGFYEIHIITTDKLFSLGGAEKDVLISIADEINLK